MQTAPVVKVSCSVQLLIGIEVNVIDLGNERPMLVAHSVTHVCLQLQYFRSTVVLQLFNKNPSNRSILDGL